MRSTAAGAALCYHRVGDPQGRPGFELVPALGTRAFVRQLRLLRAHFRLVRAGELREAVAARRRASAIPLAVTFDDDLACHVRTAELLSAERVPATFFLGGTSLAGPRTFFWDALQAALDAGLAPDDPVLPRVPDPRGPGGVHRLADAIRGLEKPVRDQLTAALLERADGVPRDPGLRAAAVERLARSGFELGFHTRDHESLDLLGDGELTAALRTGRSELEDIAGRSLRTIAYPFGRADVRVAAAARAAGFAAGFTLAARPVSIADDPLLLGRFQPSFTSAAHTAVELGRRLAGVGRS